MLSYPARLVQDGAGYVVTFRDIPEAHSSGGSAEEAIEMARDALATAMDFYFEDRRSVPAPSKTKRGEVDIELPVSLSAKVILLNEMLSSGVSPAQLARKLHTTPQAVTRIVDLRHATKIDTIADALGVLGKKLKLSVT